MFTLCTFTCNMIYGNLDSNRSDEYNIFTMTWGLFFLLKLKEKPIKLFTFSFGYGQFSYYLEARM